MGLEFDRCALEERSRITRISTTSVGHLEGIVVSPSPSLILFL